RFCRQCPRSCSRGSNYTHFPTDQISRQGRQPVIVTVGPAVLDRQILTLNKAELTKTLVKEAEKVRRLGRRLAAEEPDYGYWLLRPCQPADTRLLRRAA